MSSSTQGPERVIALRERVESELRGGDAAAAEAAARRLLALAEEVHGPGDWPTIAAHRLLAAAHKAQGRWPEAALAYEREIALSARRLGECHLALAPRLLVWAEALRRAGREREALAAEARGHRIHAAADPSPP